VAEVWANWSPNHTEGPQDYTPIWPEDSRGTWHVHDKIPGGHEGPDGVYQRDNPGNGNSDWFYRQNAQPEKVVVITEGTPEIPAVPGTPAIPAVTQTINHPAVVCDSDEPETETPEVTNEPENETPVSVPQPPKPTKHATPAPPKDVQVIECIDGVWVTTVNGEVISESGTCERSAENNTPQTFSETGL
jgi:hypothetical protein